MFVFVNLPMGRCSFMVKAIGRIRAGDDYTERLGLVGEFSNVILSTEHLESAAVFTDGDLVTVCFCFVLAGGQLAIGCYCTSN